MLHNMKTIQLKSLEKIIGGADENTVFYFTGPFSREFKFGQRLLKTRWGRAILTKLITKGYITAQPQT